MPVILANGHKGRGNFEIRYRVARPRCHGGFFGNQTPEALQEGVRIVERHNAEFKPSGLRRNAERFGQEGFRRELRATVEELWNRFQRGDWGE